MKVYNNLEEIKYDLKRLHLERQIAWEEMKGLKNEVKEDLSPYNWLGTILSAVKKYGILYLVRKLFR
ncbi:hypothetical protein [Ulvibacterium marinum]|uniref:Glutaminyl-tRNA synthetase n=1 Tax=Ulvibacterium marinum TaxID=2419782 RepID=A0A3B0BP14_9FLAO|nr:hypothetical protein [Ulvibacterium marinum]RKN75133.1 hypothetical protein D7Z94_25375 [Ulvibacterium marinum]